MALSCQASSYIPGTSPHPCLDLVSGFPYSSPSCSQPLSSYFWPSGSTRGAHSWVLGHLPVSLSLQHPTGSNALFTRERLYSKLLPCRQFQQWLHRGKIEKVATEQRLTGDFTTTGSASGDASSEAYRLSNTRSNGWGAE